MASKWGMHVPVNISAAVRDDKKSGRPSNVQQLNEISLALQGQQTVQDIVNRATNLFRLMEEAKMVVDHNKNKRIQETLSAIKELFARLRVIYDESNRRVVTPQAENLEAMIPLKPAEEEPEDDTPKDATALQIEHDTLQEKLRSKNQEIKDLIDQLRTLMWDINTMMAVKPS